MQQRTPWMIRGYLKARASKQGKPLDIGPTGAAGLRKFGTQLALVAAALLVLCFFLPADGRRWVFVGIGVLTALAGWWHIANAQVIIDHARADQEPQQEASR